MTELARRKPAGTLGWRKYRKQDVIDALVDARGMIAPAARRLGASRTTILSYIDQYPEIAQAVADQREAVTDLAETRLYDAIQDREAWAICFYLKTQAKRRGYVERAEVTGSNGAPVNIKLVYD